MTGPTYTCTAWGDPHYTTFGGLVHHLYDKGLYEHARFTIAPCGCEVVIQTFLASLGDASAITATAVRVGDTTFEITGGGNVTIFCKGSAENVGSRCLPASIPEGYTEQSKKHALEGCYVISLGHRELGPMDDDAITRMDRDSAEQGLTWLGLILFRNELKPDTAQAIAKLKAGNVRCTMITGDNAQCGCYIARASGLVADDSCVLLADTTADGQVQWLEMVTTGAPLGPFTTEEVLAGHGAAELACTGTAFEALVASEQMQPLVTRMRIFSRMSPDGKVLAVELLIAKGLNV